ncbi:hypothetical protein [Cryptosporangium sp. NPDC048952]|uniref:hypothetical protein n=1 Tax=Cryptosporangium sp. NPDC048952 TaxID=3363961 RepID=UPI003716ED16
MSLDTIDSTETWSSPPPITWPPAPPAPPPPRRRRPLLAALLGLLCGALVVGGVWLGNSLLTEPTPGPDGAADKACGILADLPAATADSLLRSDGAALRTAGELSATAASGDQQYRRLADATRQAYLASTDLDPALVNRQIGTALSECGR